MPPEPQPIRIHFSLTFSDYLRMVYRAAFRQMRWMVLGLAFCLFLYAMLELLYLARPAPSGPPPRSAIHGLIFVALAVTALYFPLIYVASSLRFRRAREMHGPRTYEFSVDGIQTWGTYGDDAISWQNIKSVKRTGSVMLLEMEGRRFHIVPLRAFRDPEQWESFRQLVEHYVPGSRLSLPRSVKFIGDLPPVTVEKGPPSAGDASVNANVDSTPSETAAAETMRVHFAPTLSGFLRLNLPFLMVRLFLGLIGATVLVSALAMLVDDMPAFLEPFRIHFFVAIALVYFLGFMAYFFIRLLLLWTRSAAAREPRTHSFSESGIDSESAIAAGHMNWNIIRRASRRGPFIALFSAQSLLVYFPKSAVRDDDWPNFLALLKRKVRSCRLK